MKTYFCQLRHHDKTINNGWQGSSGYLSKTLEVETLECLLTKELNNQTIYINIFFRTILGGSWDWCLRVGWGVVWWLDDFDEAWANFLELTLTNLHCTVSGQVRQSHCITDCPASSEESSLPQMSIFSLETLGWFVPSHKQQIKSLQHKLQLQCKLHSWLIQCNAVDQQHGKVKPEIPITAINHEMCIEAKGGDGLSPPASRARGCHFSPKWQLHGDLPPR